MEYLQDVSNVISIGESAFGRGISNDDMSGYATWIPCKSLKSIGDMPRLKTIDSQAFDECSSLVSVGDLSNVISIGDFAFYGCNELTRIGELESVTSIGTWAFRECTSLETIGNLRSVTEIGNAAFYGCKSLTLRVLPNSYAENYAKSNNIPYTYIED